MQLSSSLISISSASVTSSTITFSSLSATVTMVGSQAAAIALDTVQISSSTISIFNSAITIASQPWAATTVVYFGLLLVLRCTALSSAINVTGTTFTGGLTGTTTQLKLATGGLLMIEAGSFSSSSASVSGGVVNVYATQTSVTSTLAAMLYLNQSTSSGSVFLFKSGTANAAINFQSTTAAVVCTAVAAYGNTLVSCNISLKNMTSAMTTNPSNVNQLVSLASQGTVLSDPSLVGTSAIYVKKTTMTDSNLLVDLCNQQVAGLAAFGLATYVTTIVGGSISILRTTIAASADPVAAINVNLVSGSFINTTVMIRDVWFSAKSVAFLVANVLVGATFSNTALTVSNATMSLTTTGTSINFGFFASFITPYLVVSYAALVFLTVGATITSQSVISMHALKSSVSIGATPSSTYGIQLEHATLSYGSLLLTQSSLTSHDQIINFDSSTVVEFSGLSFVGNNLSTKGNVFYADTRLTWCQIGFTANRFSNTFLQTGQLMGVTQHNQASNGLRYYFSDNDVDDGFTQYLDSQSAFDGASDDAINWYCNKMYGMEINSTEQIGVMPPDMLRYRLVPGGCPFYGVYSLSPNVTITEAVSRSQGTPSMSNTTFHTPPRPHTQTDGFTPTKTMSVTDETTKTKTLTKTMALTETKMEIKTDTVTLTVNYTASNSSTLPVTRTVMTVLVPPDFSAPIDALVFSTAALSYISLFFLVFATLLTGDLLSLLQLQLLGAAGVLSGYDGLSPSTASLSPFYALGDIAMVLGNLAIVIVANLGVWCFSEEKGDGDAPATTRSSRLFDVLYNRYSLAVSAVFFSGIVSGSLQLFAFSSSAGNIAVAVIGSAFSIVFWATLMISFWQHQETLLQQSSSHLSLAKRYVVFWIPPPSSSSHETVKTLAADEHELQDMHDHEAGNGVDDEGNQLEGGESAKQPPSAIELKLTAFFRPVGFWENCAGQHSNQRSRWQEALCPDVVVNQLGEPTSEMGFSLITMFPLGLYPLVLVQLILIVTSWAGPFQGSSAGAACWAPAGIASAVVILFAVIISIPALYPFYRSRGMHSVAVVCSALHAANFILAGFACTGESTTSNATPLGAISVILLIIICCSASYHLWIVVREPSWRQQHYDATGQTDRSSFFLEEMTPPRPSLKSIIAGMPPAPAPKKQQGSTTVTRRQFPLDSRSVSKLVAYDERKLQEAIAGAESCEAALVAIAAANSKATRIGPLTRWRAPTEGAAKSRGLEKNDDAKSLRMQYLVQITCFRQSILHITQRLQELQPDRVL